MIEQPLNQETSPKEGFSHINFTWTKLIISIVLFVALQFLVGIGVSYLNPSLLQNANNVLLINISSNILSILSIFLIYRYSNVIKKFLRDGKSFRYITTEGLKWGAIIVLINMLLGVIVSVIYSLLGQAITPQNVSSLMTSDTSSPIIVFLAIVIAAPLAEELLFRGVIYNTFKQQTKTLSAIVFSSLIFALIHFDPSYIPQLWVMGMVLAYSYYKTDSIKVPVIAHMVVNLFSFIVTMLLAVAA